jgi:hypothetical protein
MADINQVISLGIGAPSGIPEFLTLGLQIGAAVDITAHAKNLFTVDAEQRCFIVEPEDRMFTVT